MLIISKNVEANLVESVKAVQKETGEFYSLHFHTSLLSENYRSEFQQRIAVNILNDIFRNEKGNIVVSYDGDIFVIYHGDDKELLEKAIFQVRYLFVDDPLANHKDGSENSDFCTMYDLVFQWKDFHKICHERLSLAKKGALLSANSNEKENLITPARLAEIELELDNLDISLAFRKQPICAVKDTKEANPIFHEMYVNISHLEKMLSKETKLTSEKWLFKYITELLDHHVLDVLSKRNSVHTEKPISLNLNVGTVLSDEFRIFCDSIKKRKESSIVIEIDVADVFENMKDFLKAKDVVQKYGHRICLDGLNNKSFVQVDRKHLGFDLIKLRWNADMVGDLASEENEELKEAIKKCGSNRMILCRCDSIHAIEYGKALGISLFQGRYTDRIVNPNTTVTN